MSAEDLVQGLRAHPLPLMAWALGLPLLAIALGWLHPATGGAKSPWKYGYAALVYCACVPGMLAGVLTAYTLFFTSDDLRHVNLLAYLAPIATMGVTLGLIRRRVAFHDIPGFDRIEGLLAIIAATFITILAIRKTSIWIVLHGSVLLLVLLAGAIFGLLKWGAAAVFGPAPASPSSSETRDPGLQ